MNDIGSITDEGMIYRVQRMIEIGIALSAERDTNRLMELILLEAKDLTNADGGTLYLRTGDDALKFEIMRTDSLNIALGGTTGKEITFPPIRMFDPETGVRNEKNVASFCALTGCSINIEDAYKAKDFDFSGTKKFDEGTGFRSKSFLTVPLRNSQGEIIGVLQLLNAIDPNTEEVIAFSTEIQPLVEALASQAAVSLDNQQLLDSQRRLLDSFIELIAAAIDAKSPYTGGHCQRVPEITKMLAEAACGSTEEPFADFSLNDDQWYELTIAAWLHDCGKVTTPEYVVDKAVKLETIYNRIHEIRTRFEILKRDAEIDYLRALNAGDGDPAVLKADFEKKVAQLDEDFAFVAKSNRGGEFMEDADIERLKKIATTKWTRTMDDRVGLSFEESRRKETKPPEKLPVQENLLADRYDHIVERGGPEIAADPDNPYGFKVDVPKNKYNMGELYNLCIRRGTLTPEERFKINDHVVQSIIMLENLPFPKHLKRVPEFAGGHHEKMDGTGYPKRLTGNEMSMPARIMAIADIFEALTAVDRPYKTPKKLSESIRILSSMSKEQHIDPDLFKLFLTSGVYKTYAEQYLQPFQLDEVDIRQYLDD